MGISQCTPWIAEMLKDIAKHHNVKFGVTKQFEEIDALYVTHNHAFTVLRCPGGRFLIDFDAGYAATSLGESFGKVSGSRPNFEDGLVRTCQVKQVKMRSVGVGNVYGDRVLGFPMLQTSAPVPD